MAAMTAMLKIHDGPISKTFPNFTLLSQNAQLFRLSAPLCASLTPAPRFQDSSSLCPSPLSCITRNIKRHLPYPPFFSSFFLSSHIYFLSHSLPASLHFLSFFQYLPSSLSLYCIYL